MMREPSYVPSINVSGPAWRDTEAMLPHLPGLTASMELFASSVSLYSKLLPRLLCRLCAADPLPLALRWELAAALTALRLLLLDGGMCGREGDADGCSASGAWRSGTSADGESEAALKSRACTRGACACVLPPPPLEAPAPGVGVGEAEREPDGEPSGGSEICSASGDGVEAERMGEPLGEPEGEATKAMCAVAARLGHSGRDRAMRGRAARRSRPRARERSSRSSSERREADASE
jgi:hypothetical protein